MELLFENLLYDAELNYPSTNEEVEGSRTFFNGLHEVCEKIESEYKNASIDLNRSTIVIKMNGKEYKITTRYRYDQWAFSKVDEDSSIVIAIHGEMDEQGSIYYFVINIDRQMDGKFKNHCTEKQWTIKEEPEKREDNEIYRPKELKLVIEPDAIEQIVTIIKEYIKTKGKRYE